MVSYTVRFIPPESAFRLVNLYHLARTALSGQDSDTPHGRMIWASKEYNKEFPAVSSTAAYKDLCGLLDR